jgi:hypothetical protein
MGITALVLGFFASTWFGWGHQSAEGAWVTVLNVGSVVAICVAVAGAVLGLRSPGANAALRDSAAGKRYGIIVGIEFTLAGLGAAVLGVTGQAEFAAPWVCAVVGVHFFPLASVLRDRLLVPLGVLLCVVAVIATVVGLATTVGASAVVGVGAGMLLLVFGAVALAKTIRTPKTPTA